MSVDREDIITWIDELDTPDEPTQRQVRERLVAHAEPFLDLLTANLSVVDGRTRRGLVRVLAESGHREALLPLMRFVHDTSGEHQERDARAIATRNLRELASDDDSGRLFEFYMDMRDDDDPFVRGYVVEGLGALGDGRAKPFVRDALDDEHEFVREKAAQAAEKLRNSDRRATDDTPGRAELERKLETASGARLRFLVEELVRHDDGFEIARDLLFDGDRHVMTAIQALRRIGDSRARGAARTFLKTDRSDSARAAALRLLADFIDGDATTLERRIVERALHDRDLFVRLAGLEAAARSGDRELVLGVIDRAVDDGLDGIETVAEGLASAQLDQDGRVADDILDLLRQVRLEMRHSDGGTWTMSAAYLLRALKKAAPADWPHRAEAVDLALRSLRDRLESRPIAVTALELLLALVPDEGLPRPRRWHPDDVQLLVDAARRHGDDLLPRVLELVARCAPASDVDLGDWLEAALPRLETPDERKPLIRALREVRPDQAEALLEELGRDDNTQTKKAAEAALRRVRNDREVINVDFRRAAQDSPD